MTVQETLDDYLAAPGPGRLAALHDAILTLPDYRRELPFLANARIMAGQGRHREAVGVLNQHAETAVFSPAFHRLMGECLTELGAHAEAMAQARLEDASLAAVLGSGKGTEDAPWTVLHAADEYEVLRARGVSAVSQQAYAGAHILDAVDCSDGARYWFMVV